MGLLSKLMGRSEEVEAAAEPAPALCSHLVMVPRWDSVDDIGHAERATSYRCEACGREFSPTEARSLQSSEGERLRDVVPAEEEK